MKPKPTPPKAGPKALSVLQGAAGLSPTLGCRAAEPKSGPRV